MHMRSLSDIFPGHRYMVVSMELDNAMCRRLIDMGVVPNAEISLAFTAPSGSPIAFWIKGALIALRRDDCCKILVKERV